MLPRQIKKPAIMIPTLAITIGDPAGIGPEIILKALQQKNLHDKARLLIIGSQAVMKKTAHTLNIKMAWPAFQEKPPWRSTPGSTPILQVGNLTPEDYRAGQIAAVTGQNSAAYVEAAVRLGKRRVIEGMVTAPINKEALRAAGIQYPGHTEILGARFNEPVETMFVVENLRIFFLTRHLSLRNAIDAISKPRLLHLLGHARAVLKELGIQDPVIGVAGLNPHAGEGGLFGDEEIVRLQPAIREAQERGWDVRGPVGADSIFHQALQGRYDAVVALYHDQGHIAAKTYDFNRTVSVTTGLPIIRTSVDHGTAFDIAGRGIADPSNMIEAIKVAIDMAGKRPL